MKTLLVISILFIQFVSYSQETDSTMKCYATNCGDVKESLLKKAEQKYEEGNLKKSILIYEKALCFRPSDQKVICRLEELYLEKEKLLNDRH